MSTEKDNILEEIRSGAIAEKGHAMAASEEIKNLRDKKKKRAVMMVMLESEFTRKEALLDLRRTREVEKAKKKYLTGLTELDKKIEDGGQITINEYELEKNKLQKELRESSDKAEEEYHDYKRQLSSQTRDLRWEYED